MAVSLLHDRKTLLGQNHFFVSLSQDGVMYFLESDSLDPHYNLALEQYVFDVLAV